MADADSLKNKSPANTFKDILHVNNSGQGAGESQKVVRDGNGNALPMSISKSQFGGNFGNGIIQNSVQQSVKKKVLSDTDAKNAIVIDTDEANVHHLILTGDITSMSFDGSLSSSDGVKKYYELIVVIEQDSMGGRATSWPGGVRWNGGSPPSLGVNPGDINIIKFITIDDGQNWIGKAEFLGIS